MKVVRYNHDSVKVVVDDSGLPVSRMEYLPYGETWFEEGNTNNAPKYNSQELDKETNYYFYNARHYDPEIGRFCTADNIVDGQYDTQGWNRYSYVKNNPVVYKDPTGHFVVQIPFTEKYLYVQQKPETNKPKDPSINEPKKNEIEILGYRMGITTKKEGRYVDPAPDGLLSKKKISMKNNNPDMPSPDKKVNFKTADLVEDTVKKTGASINVNSSARRGPLYPGNQGKHGTGEAVDINEINGNKVINMNKNEIGKFQDAANKNKSIYENFGPSSKTKKLSPNNAPVNWDVGGHKDHVHLSSQ